MVRQWNSLSDDWVRQSEPGVPPSNVVHYSFVKDGLHRRVFMSDGMPNPDVDQNTLIKRPAAAYVEQVYRPGDFSQLGIGT